MGILYVVYICEKEKTKKAASLWRLSVFHNVFCQGGGLLFNPVFYFVTYLASCFSPQRVQASQLVRLLVNNNLSHGWHWLSSCLRLLPPVLLVEFVAFNQLCRSLPKHVPVHKNGCFCLKTNIQSFWAHLNCQKLDNFLRKMYFSKGIFGGWVPGIWNPPLAIETKSMLVVSSKYNIYIYI